MKLHLLTRWRDLRHPSRGVLAPLRCHRGRESRQRPHLRDSLPRPRLSLFVNKAFNVLWLKGLVGYSMSKQGGSSGQEHVVELLPTPGLYWSLHLFLSHLQARFFADYRKTCPKRLNFCQSFRNRSLCAYLFFGEGFSFLFLLRVSASEVGFFPSYALCSLVYQLLRWVELSFIGCSWQLESVAIAELL